MNLHKLILFLFISLTISAQNIEEAVNLIKAENLLQTVDYLSSTELEGRLSGSKGYDKAANFIAEEYQKAGLLPWKHNSYFDSLDVEYNEIINDPEFYIKNENDKNYLEIGKDYVFRGFTGSGNFEADVIFCGYGLNENGYNDYKNIDCKNKFVMVFKQNPSWNLDENNWSINYPREKSKTAKENGAKGIIFLSVPNDNNPQKPIISILHGSGEQLTDFPQIHLSLDHAEKFFPKNKSVKIIQKMIDSLKKPQSFDTGKRCGVNVEARYEKNRPTVNVVGIIKGSDDKLKNEAVIIGAHLDHVGSQGSKLYAPGANDNASGSAAILEIARTFMRSNLTPKRTIIFTHFASEEQGLFGAKHFANEIEKSEFEIVAMLNMDCVGYGDSIQIGNGKSAPELWNLVKTIDEQNSNYMVKSTWKGGGADAAPFHEKNIPAAYFVTTNSYEHLHLPSDKTETLNAKLYENITKLAFRSLYEIANGNYVKEKVHK